MHILDELAILLFTEKLSLVNQIKLRKLVENRIPRYIRTRTRCSPEDSDDITGKSIEKFLIAAQHSPSKRNAAYFRAVLESAIATWLGKKHRKLEVPCSMDPGNDLDFDELQPGVMKKFMDMSNEERDIRDIIFDMRINGEKMIESIRKTGDPDVLCMCEVIVMVGNNHPMDDFKTIKHDAREMLRKSIYWDERRIRNAMLRASRSQHFKTYQMQRDQLRGAAPEQGSGD